MIIIPHTKIEENLTDLSLLLLTDLLLLFDLYHHLDA